MRKEFMNNLTELAARDKRIMLLPVDVGWGVVERFEARNPDQFINVGCAEQNAIGVAMGLAAKGFIPFVYTITNFALLRPYEFVRAAAYDKLPIRIVATGFDDEYKELGQFFLMYEGPKIFDILPNTIRIEDAERLRSIAEYDNPDHVVCYHLPRYDNRIKAGMH